MYLASGKWPAPSISPQKNFTLGQAFFAETFGTFFLCFVVLAVVSTRKPLQQFTGWVIGSTILAVGYAFGPVSGGILNPAITLAASIGDKFSALYEPAPLSYMAAQMVGGVLAAVVFKFVTHCHEYDDLDASD